MNRKVGFLGISATLVRLSAGIMAGVMAGYILRAGLRGFSAQSKLPTFRLNDYSQPRRADADRFPR